MSRTFSTSHGSVDSLNFSLRCGCSPKLRQMRTTALWLSPTSFARDRVLHWVAAAGILSRVRVTASSTLASVILRGVPGRESSASPFIPCSL
jgi:hypothetical protein